MARLDDARGGAAVGTLPRASDRGARRSGRMSTHRERTRARTLRAGCSREVRRAARRSFGGQSAITRAVIGDVGCRAGAGLEAALPRNPGCPCRNSRGKLRGRVVVSELPGISDQIRRGLRRGLGASEDLRFVVVASVESPRLAVVTRASRLAGRARRPDGGRAPLPLLPWDGKDRVEGASRTRISRWVVDLDLFSKRRQSRRSTRATWPPYGGLRRSATRSGPADAARNARIQRRRVAPVPPAGGAGLVRRRPRGRRGERAASSVRHQVRVAKLGRTARRKADTFPRSGRPHRGLCVLDACPREPYSNVILPGRLRTRRAGPIRRAPPSARRPPPVQA